VNARRVGALVGAGVGLGADLLALAVLAVAMVLLQLDGPGVTPVALVIGVVTMLTGAIVGWLAGPSGWSDPSRLSNRALIARMAIAADLLGGWLAGVAFAVGTFLAALPRPPFEIVLIPFIVGTVYAIYGIAIFGVPVLPITATAAATWIHVMDRLRDRFDPAGTLRRSDAS